MVAQKFPGDLVAIIGGKGENIWRVAEVSQNGDLLCESSRGWAYWFAPASVVEMFGPFQEHNPAGVPSRTRRFGSMRTITITVHLLLLDDEDDGQRYQVSDTGGEFDDAEHADQNEAADDVAERNAHYMAEDASNTVRVVET